MSESNQLASVTAGEERSQVVVSDLKRTQIVMYAGASGDFNPLHTDEPFSTQVAGNPTVMSHGMLVMGLASQVLTEWFGLPNVRRYRARFQSPTWPGDTISVTAKVESVEEVEGERRAEVALRATTRDGAVAVLSGSATVLVR
ncbi:MaoC/PaaZ C-terminal domain-containing protein [Amycolatopsis pigmentata]|uniref:MaoC/PaaZ C-terminal domain-containing protein n=1 Tax=Amycolatopsis pigmentata TaxID=450801 RepID=A0ABW5FQ81_9PSEU